MQPMLQRKYCMKTVSFRMQFSPISMVQPMTFSTDESGTVVVIHADGDNTPLLCYWVPRLKARSLQQRRVRLSKTSTISVVFLMATVQFSRLMNWGRLYITIIGFDLDDTNVDPMKRGKWFWQGSLAAIGHVR